MRLSLYSLLIPLFFNGLSAREPLQDFFLKADAWNEPKKVCLDTDALKNFITTHPEQKLAHAQRITLHTKSGLAVPALFFDRGSNVALIAGQGLPAPKESMLEFAQLFDRYDVIVFDYRWRDTYARSLLQSLVLCSPTQRMLFDEEQEIRAVIDFLARHKKYEKVVGLGECYSNFLFAKIQADDVQKSGKGPFTHLILDSCWLSFKSFAHSISRDPFLPCSPQQGGAPWILKKLTNCPLVKWPVMKIIFAFLDNVSIEKHLAHLNIPVLFIHGMRDLMVPKPQFEAIWKAACCGKRAALLTPYHHADNLGNKFLYRFVSEQFINTASMDEFVTACEGMIA